jgi:HK97 family phage prohead protease
MVEEELHTVFSFEARDLDPGKGPYTRIEGKAVPYDVWANVGSYMERFKPDAFKKNLSEQTKPRPLMLFHGRDDMWPIGMSTRWQSKSDGLYGVWLLDGSPNAQRAAEMAATGQLGFLSIGFVPIRTEPTEMAKDYNPALGEDHMDRVTRVEARLVEVSVVPTPAYAEAEITLVRSRPYDRPGGATPKLEAYRRMWDPVRATLSG